MGFPALWQGWIWCGRQIFAHFSFTYYTKSNIQKLCNMYFQELLIPRRWQKSSQIFAPLKDWHRWVVLDRSRLNITTNIETAALSKWCQQFWSIWQEWFWRCLLSACLPMSIDICWPKDGDTPRRQFCLSRVKIETWTVKLVAPMGLAYLLNVQALSLFLTYFDLYFSQILLFKFFFPHIFH